MGSLLKRHTVVAWGFCAAGYFLISRHHFENVLHPAANAYLQSIGVAVPQEALATSGCD